MAEPIYRLHSLTLSGFRAYLVPARFDFSKKPCLAIYAPNGKGKSSVIDALEFVFSKDGTLERLGQKAINNLAGPQALVHNLAADRGVEAAVSISYKCDGEPLNGTRSALGKRDIPVAAQTVASQFLVHPLIRGHGLRRFVEEDTPQERYAEVARWLQLAPLTEIQKNLRALKSQIKAASEDNSGVNRAVLQLRKCTAGAVLLWDNALIVAHINEAVLAPLDDTLALAALDDQDPGYVEVSARATAEENELGLAALRHLHRTGATIYAAVPGEPEKDLIVTGRLAEFEAAAQRRADAAALETEERQKAADVAFKSIWESAKTLFAVDDDTPDVCPVCVTPIADTAAGSSQAIKLHVETRLGELQAYSEAHSELGRAVASSMTARDRLIAAVNNLNALIREDSPMALAASGYLIALESWDGSAVPDASSFLTALDLQQAALVRRIAEIEAARGEHSYPKAKAAIDAILEVSREHGLAVSTKAELEGLFDTLTAQSTAVSAAIRAKMQTLLDTLQKPMQTIYHAIQGADAPPIRLELPAEEDATQQRLMLLIDFAANRPAVQPAGYLSDSQLHSVALALRLAAIRVFNTSAPFIALDDVVTSYDADHRRSIAALLASFGDTSQIIVTTHDERFFAYLHELVEPNHWHHTRITMLDPEYGPRFSDHKISDEMVEARWRVGESAANEMRRAEEEWLTKTCREFGAKLTIRPLEKPYAFDRGELASALAGLLSGLKLLPQPVPGVGNRFLMTLQKGEVENFGSHFQDNPNAFGSIGDEQTRWNEFKAFRAQFSCPKCSRNKFKQPRDLKRPVCAHEKCETPFDFAAPPPEMTAA